MLLIRPGQDSDLLTTIAKNGSLSRCCDLVAGKGFFCVTLADTAHAPEKIPDCATLILYYS